MQKLKAVKDKLRVWNKEVFGDVKLALQQTETELHHFELLAEERQLSEVEKTSRCKTKSEFWRLFRLIESKFRRNMMGSIKANGRLEENPKEIKDAAVEYFCTNFKEEQRTRTTLGGVFIRKLSPLVSSDLEKQFDEGEIVSALKGCSSLKAPCFDGFNFSFIRKGWVDCPTRFKEFRPISMVGILDGVLIANEVIHSWKNRSQEASFSKLILREHMIM
ncbi:uncharacterized protein LOC131328514 [Rhododendron vialii]|uniref:uncharacterized protein LOC131328514 n=1 Tax=Rhododendron vialii TaxID=182163 RepID=UPI00265EF01A|nr:uncharacterized protein LOC131328514 [Rhododendron vialii]